MNLFSPLIWCERVVEKAAYGWSVTREAGASVLSYELYPLAVLRNPTPYVPSLRKSQEKRNPILFLHGVLQNPATFTVIKQRLAWNGVSRFQEVNLLASVRSVEQNAKTVREIVEFMQKKHGTEKVDIIAHSLGGIIARYYIQILGGEENVERLITLGTPHYGSEHARFSPLPATRELIPESKTLARLNCAPLPLKTRVVSIAGDLDIMIKPRNSALWKGSKNYALTQVGHAGLLFSKRASQIILDNLNDADKSPSRPTTGRVA